MDIALADGTALLVPDEAVSAIRRRAERHADLLVERLTSCGLSPDGFRAPKAFIIEAAALLQLRIWEETGLSRSLDGDTPSYQEACAQFLERAAKGRIEFLDGAATPLMNKVIGIFLDQIAWEGLDLLGADVVIGDMSEDAFVEAIAQFFFEHRGELESVLCEAVADHD